MIRSQVSALKRKTKRRIVNALYDRLMNAGWERPGRRPFDAEELQLVREALVSQNLCCIDGRMVASFEKEFAYLYGVPYAVASTSGTAAIHVALGALDLNPGDEVITAPITDMGTIIPILYQSCIPVFADIDDTYNMDPADVERKISPRTRAIIAVHLFGNPCNLDALVELARRRGIPLIEDCAQAHLAEYRGKYVGAIGDIGCFSFQQSKQMTTGDGGMTITNNKDYYERMKLFADKGYARKGWGARAYLFHAPNYRMNEMVGAVGRAQLGKIKGVIEKRRALAVRLSEALSQIEGIDPAPVTPGATHSFWLYPMRLEGMDAESFAQIMKNERIPMIPGYIGKPIYLCSESLAAKKTYGTSQWPFTCNNGQTYEYKPGLCPNAEETLKRLVCLPLDESWSTSDVDRVAAKIGSVMAGAIRIASPSREKAPLLTPAAEKSDHKIRIGIIGCGQMGGWHLESYRRNPGVKVVAVADTELGRAEAFARKAEVMPYASHLEMMNRERLDGVSVCTVPATHRDIVIDLLRGGVHVLCEKPLAVSLQQAKEMAYAAKQHDRLLFTAFKFRFYEEVARAKELIASGALGRIVNFRLMFGGYLSMAGTWYAARELAGGGVIMDNGPHAFDLIRFLFGEIEHVSTEILNVQDLEVEDTAKLTVSVRGGIVGVVDLSWSMPVPSAAYLEIYGADGAALLDLEGISYRFKNWNQWKRIHNQLDVKEAFARQVDYFISSILGAAPKVLGNGEGVKSQAVIAAAYESIRQTRAVRVSEDVS